MQSPAEFYGSARGVVTTLILRSRLHEMWPAQAVAGQSLLGLGYARPYLRLWREDAARCINLTPGQIASCRWPAGALSMSCAAEESALPFPDLSFDRILLVHGIESADHARRMLREAWRVLRDDGRLLVVTPNRRGLWAHAETTPFGQGQPYSPGQIERLLAEALFRTERRDVALFVPPTRSRLILRKARLWEDGGRWIAPQLAGLNLSEAVKDVYAALPHRADQRRRVLVMEAA